MLDILKNFDDAADGKKPTNTADKGSMKAILESIQSVEECGDMPTSATEAPMMPGAGHPVTVSVTASGKENVADLISMMQQAAGIEQHVDMPMAHDAHIDTDSHNVSGQEMDMATMRSIMSAGDDEAPAEEEASEEWDNSPDEEYRDTKYMTKDISGGLNGEKPRKALRVKDPALESIKESLWKALKEKKSKPDFLDMDKDGDKKEPMKKAIKDKKAKKESVQEKTIQLPTGKEMKKCADDGMSKKEIMDKYKGCDKDKLEKLYASSCGSH